MESPECTLTRLMTPPTGLVTFCSIFCGAHKEKTGVNFESSADANKLHRRPTYHGGHDGETLASLDAVALLDGDLHNDTGL